ncbi:MAG: hypothetical protein ACHQF2_10880, partial [Flavobacteriales bacterium]
MKGKRGILLVLVLVSAGVLALLFMLDNPNKKNDATVSEKKKGKKEKIKRKKNDWEKKYGHRNLDPYGTFIFYNLLKVENKKRVRVLKRASQYEWMDTIGHGGKLYMYIGTSFPDNRFHLKRVMEMVKKGNSAFISAEVFPDRIIRMLNRTHHLYTKFDSSMTSFFEHPTFNDTVGSKFNYVYKNRGMRHYWSFFYPHRPVVMRICVPGEKDTILKDIWIPEGKYATTNADDEYTGYESESNSEAENTGSDQMSDVQRLLDSLSKSLHENTSQTQEEENGEDQEDQEFIWTDDMRALYTEEEWIKYKALYND